MLSKRSFEKARQFILTGARPLEVARFRRHFEGAPVNEVTAALEVFQNPDGGFGNALEPDLRTPVSSVLATSTALDVLRDVGISEPSPLTDKAMVYLAQTYNSEKQSWRIIPADAEDSPHAPWWSQEGLEATFGHFGLNPTAKLLGYLYDYAGQVPPGLAATVLGRIEAQEEMDMNDFLCCKRLLGTKGLEPGYREAVRKELLRFLDRTVTLDPAQWENYGLRPLHAADNPASAFYAPMQEAVLKNLEYEVATQKEDGSWPVPWTWGGNYPEAWEQAAREWAGIITLETLVTLKEYGWIEA